MKPSLPNCQNTAAGDHARIPFDRVSQDIGITTEWERTSKKRIDFI